MLRINDNLSIEDKYIEMEFILASGPGGQNVNKVSTAVRLRFHLDACDTLPLSVKQRMISLNHRSISKEGVLIITARKYRSQEKNRQDALHKLTEMVLQAIEKPKTRRKTRIPRVSKLNRLEQKNKRSTLKSARSKIDPHSG